MSDTEKVLSKLTESLWFILAKQKYTCCSYGKKNHVSESKKKKKVCVCLCVKEQIMDKKVFPTYSLLLTVSIS